jgi:hypothetical protein
MTITTESQIFATDLSNFFLAATKAVAKQFYKEVVSKPQIVFEGKTSIRFKSGTYTIKKVTKVKVSLRSIF